MTKRRAWLNTGPRQVSVVCPGPASAAVSPRNARYTGTSASTHGETKLNRPAAKARARLTSISGRGAAGVEPGSMVIGWAMIQRLSTV